MNDDALLKEAQKKVENRSLLINMVTRRVRQLSAGAHPLVEAYDLPYARIALKEIAEGKLEARPVDKEEITPGEIID